jgi:hypothetical protein
MGYQTIFRTALEDTGTKALEALGVRRVELDSKWGEREFRYVQNRSGGTLNKDSLVMYDGPPAGDITVTAASDDVHATTAGSFVTNKFSVGDIVYVVDDAGAGGAAPEGETSFITSVTPTVITFSPALSTPLAVGDKVNVLKRFSIIAAAAAGGKRVAGIPMANIADLGFGWVQTRGIYPSADVIAAGTAVAEGARLAAGAALLTLMLTVANNNASAEDINEVAVATALQPLASDTVRRKAVVMLDLI